VEQIPSLETNSCWGIQEIHGLLWYPAVNYRVQRILLLDSIQYRMNPVHIQLICLRSVVVLLSHFRLISSGLLLSGFLTKIFLHIFVFSHAWYTVYSLCTFILLALALSLLDEHQTVYYEVLITQFFPAHCHLLPHSYNCFSSAPYYPILPVVLLP
jgi:hypothetical protein